MGRRGRFTEEICKNRDLSLEKKHTVVAAPFEVSRKRGNDQKSIKYLLLHIGLTQNLEYP